MSRGPDDPVTRAPAPLARRAAGPRRRSSRRLHRRRLPAPSSSSLRRHHPGLLPGVAAGVHPQPGRDRLVARRSRSCPRVVAVVARLRRARGVHRPASSSWRRRARDHRSATSSAPSRSSATTCRPSSRRGRTGSTISASARSTSWPRRTASSTISTTTPASWSGPLQQLAVASLGALGNLLIVADPLALHGRRPRRDPVLPVPAGPAGLRRRRPGCSRRSVARSFGGFLRGQAIMGVVYGAIAAVTSVVLGLPYLAVRRAASGVLMAIPFFGPFVSWAPPVIVALLVKPEAASRP